MRKRAVQINKYITFALSDYCRGKDTPRKQPLKTLGSRNTTR